METRELVLTNRYGKRMPATLRLPDGESKGTVLVLHGLAGWKDQPTVVTIAEAARTAGYVSLTFDGADCLKGPDASYWNSTVRGFIEDTEDVVAFSKKTEWFKAPLILAGHSLGGLCAVHYARKHPGEAERLLLVAPSISWTKDRSGKFLKKIRFTFEAVQKRRSESSELVMPLYPPWIFDFMRYDTRHDAPYIAVPVYIVSAGDDLIVAPAIVHEALTHKFPNGQHVVVAHASHTFEGHEQELAAIVTRWLAN